MFCSGCGQPLAQPQAFCGNCGRPAAGVFPPIPGLQFQLESYAGKIRLLSIFWLIYAGLSLLLAFAGLSFARALMSGSMGPWSHGPMLPNFFGPAMIHFIWIMMMLRAVLIAAAAWGLLHHERWGQILAVVVAILCLVQFPFGTALGIWTLTVLLGYRNASLYEQL